MVKSIGKAVWEGTLKEGSGTVELADSQIFTGPYSFASRFESGAGSGKTNPEELIGAAHAGCYAMFLGSLLTNNETPATKLTASSEVLLGAGPAIKKIKLSVEGDVPNISAEKFDELAREAKEKCPVTKALAGVEEITLEAKLL